MAPTATQSPLEVPQSKTFSYDNPSKSVFPDGIKTSGQRAPESEHVAPYSDYPKVITGDTVWNRDDYQHNPERWTHHFSEEEVSELSKTADAFMASDTPLTGITQVCHPFP